MNAKTRPRGDPGAARADVPRLRPRLSFRLFGLAPLSEYELHLIRRSSGHFYVGTYAGEFGPGNLVMTGPPLPHMWISVGDERDPDGRIAGRDLVLQLSAGFAERCVAGFSDCAGLAGLLEASRAGYRILGGGGGRRRGADGGAAGGPTASRGWRFSRPAPGLSRKTAGAGRLSLKGADHECAQPRAAREDLALHRRELQSSKSVLPRGCPVEGHAIGGIVEIVRTTHQMYMPRIHQSFENFIKPVSF